MRLINIYQLRHQNLDQKNHLLFGMVERPLTVDNCSHRPSAQNYRSAIVHLDPTLKHYQLPHRSLLNQLFDHLRVQSEQLFQPQPVPEYQRLIPPQIEN